MAEPAPAPVSTRISSPACCSLPSASGTRATRRSPGAVSLATPTFMAPPVHGVRDRGALGRAAGTRAVRAESTVPVAKVAMARGLRLGRGAARRCGLRSQLRADLPEVGERRPEQGPAQVLDTAGTAGAAFRADRPFDHLHVPVAPLLD